MNDEAFLFVHFTGDTGDGEQIYFSVSRDGLNWHDLNSGKPVLISELGDKGARDPFIVRESGGKYHIIATDLRIANGEGWERAQYSGSRAVSIWDSDDLIHWGNQRLINIGVPEAGCVWAPECIYCESEKKFMVFWASMVREQGEEKARQRIYASFTTDFCNFSSPFKYIEMDNHVIDTTIVRDGSWYYRISKDETTKGILMTRSHDLINGPFEQIHSPSIDALNGVEGPEIYYIHKLNRWCLIVDRFATGMGYMPMLAESLERADFKKVPDNEYDMGTFKKRHGSVIAISDAEYQSLWKEFPGRD